MNDAKRCLDFSHTRLLLTRLARFQAMGSALIQSGGLEGTRAINAAKLGQFVTEDETVKAQMGAMFQGILRAAVEKLGDLIGKKHTVQSPPQ